MSSTATGTRPAISISAGPSSGAQPLGSAASSSARVMSRTRRHAACAVHRPVVQHHQPVLAQPHVQFDAISAPRTPYRTPPASCPARSGPTSPWCASGTSRQRSMPSNAMAGPVSASSSRSMRFVIRPARAPPSPRPAASWRRSSSPRITRPTSSPQRQLLPRAGTRRHPVLSRPGSGRAPETALSRSVRYPGDGVMSHSFTQLAAISPVSSRKLALSGLKLGLVGASRAAPPVSPASPRPTRRPGIACTSVTYPSASTGHDRYRRACARLSSRKRRPARRAVRPCQCSTSSSLPLNIVSPLSLRSIMSLICHHIAPSTGLRGRMRAAHPPSKQKNGRRTPV